MMRFLQLKMRLIVPLVVLCCLAGASSFVVQAQTPTSGAMVTIKGTVNSAVPVAVNLTIYDSQIHSGTVQTPPCDPNFPTDAYVLQGGSWTGCDNGDAYEVTDVPLQSGFHQYFGKADLTGTGYSFHIETHYRYGVGVCNTSGTICTGPAGPDSGFLTVTNNSGAPFTGTITLQGNSIIAGGLFCPVNGAALDTWTTGLGTSASVTLALGSQGVEGPNYADSSNCGGFNATQMQVVTQGVTSKFQIGNDDFEITPSLGGTGDSITLLVVPVPAGPLTNGGFGPGPNPPVVQFPLVNSRFSATNYPGQASIPYADLSAPGNPVGLEFHLTCSPNPTTLPLNDCNSFIYTARTDFTIDPNTFPGGIGGAHFLGIHNSTCPTTAFNVDIFLSYTGGVGDPPLLGSSDGTSCFAGTFDPTVAAVPAGTTVKQQTLVGFDFPVSDTRLNYVEAGDSVPLIWQTFDSFGKPVKNLTLCPNSAGTGCVAPWVFIGTIPINCSTDQPLNTPEMSSQSLGNSGLINFKNGLYLYLWKTVRGSVGCVTPVLQFSTGLVSLNVANFKFVHDDD
jgi:hypothetical protein